MVSYKLHITFSDSTPGFEPTTFRSQYGDANHSAIPPPYFVTYPKPNAYDARS